MAGSDGALRYHLRRGARLLATLHGAVPSPSALASSRVPSTAVLSRFALLRRGEEGLVLESPLATSVLHVHDDIVVRHLAFLARQQRGRVPTPLLTLLQAAGFLASHDQELPGWSLADALAHARSRAGRHLGGFGATFPLRDGTPPDPAIKPPMSRNAVTLPRPRRIDSLGRVLEKRRSLRDYASRPLTTRALGEFLYRSARVQTGVVPVGADRPDDVTFRPSPSGGACHSLELYLGIHDCDGLRRGLYHYDPLHHRLEVLTRTASAATALLTAARAGVPGEGMPQAIILITSRFARVMWKYESMAYATILKDAGALLQTMYLVATSMGLAPCAVGGGDSQFFADAVGTDFFAETTVAEFLLGVPR